MLGRVIVGLTLLLLHVDGIIVSTAAGEAGTGGADDERHTGLRARKGHKIHEHIVKHKRQQATNLEHVVWHHRATVAASEGGAAPQRFALSFRQSLEHAFGNGEMSANMLWAYVSALLAMVVIVSVMFFPMGRNVIFQVVLYVSCLAFVKIAMKAVFRFGFNFPKFITSLHLLVSSLAAFSVLVYRSRSDGKPIAIPTSSEFLWRLMPISLTFGLSIGAENSALVFVSAAFSEVVASSNPVMSALLTWACGMPFHMQLLAPIAMVVAGCVVSVTGELFFSSFGLALLLFSVFCRSLKAVMQQQLMSGETKEKFDPVTLMAWTCLLSFVEMVMYSLFAEGLAPITALSAHTNIPGLSAAIVFSCIVACTLNISALFVIRQLGAVGMQMVSQMKAILVVVGGMALLNESFTTMQQIGFLMVLSGVYWYSRWKMLLVDANAKGH